MKRSAIERQPGESAQAYAAALAYFRLGAGRSLAALNREWANSRPLSLSLLKRWSATYRWVDRAEAWDAELARVEQRAFQAAAAAAAKKWVTRAEALRERQFQIAERLLDHCEQMLAWPLTEITRGEDQSTIIRPNGRWNLNTARLLAETASELAAAAIADAQADRPEEVEYQFENVDFIDTLP